MTAIILVGRLQDTVEDGPTVYSDDHKGYDGIDLFQYYETVKHAVGKCVNDMAHTRGIESFWILTKLNTSGAITRCVLSTLAVAMMSSFVVSATIRQVEKLVRNFDRKWLTYSNMKVVDGLNTDPSKLETTKYMYSLGHNSTKSCRSRMFDNSGTPTKREADKY